MDIELHVFTNSTDKYSPSTKIIDETIISFNSMFVAIPMYIWCDPRPNKKSASEYISRLKKKYPIVHTTASLSDGYIRAIKSSNSEYMFMLEHDWSFIPPIKSLKEIMEIMDCYKIAHLRFNKRSNIITNYDRKLIEADCFCWTNWVSNNPHIIHRERWIKQAMPHVKVTKRTGGIEHNLGNKGVAAAIYGPLGYEKKVNHLDGRGKTKK